MLKPDMIDKLTQQMNDEFFSSNLYLQMSAWCRDKAYEGAATFFRAHAHEEMTHMMRLFDYLDGTGSMPIIGKINAPQSAFSSLNDVLELAYQHEQSITKSINELADFAITTKDYPTFNFLQWFLNEQHEEEKLFKTLLDRLLLAGQSGEGLFLVDNEMGHNPAHQQ
ncbi:non-heme ferritin (plasmid) [Edwardsiella tarda]|uniref:non-heme ferritin n=1 Tax=Edwardsiella tarda TaxID=636 RepID=UPI002444B9ED|nr:non-heme ferritin [Edwardsiella tarda]WGE30888.1 non-heme ferritin [Edwardsiella tarda]